MVLSSLSCTLTPPIKTSNGSVGAPEFSFSSNTTTGMYLVGKNTLGFSTNGVLRRTIDTVRITTTLPIRLPNDNSNFSDFGFYEVLNMTLIMRYSATQTFNWPLIIVRIDQNITYHFSADVTMYTIANAPRNVDNDTNTIPTRLRCNVNTAIPYVYLTGGIVWTVAKIIVKSNGTVSFGPFEWSI